MSDLTDHTLAVTRRRRASRVRFAKHAHAVAHEISTLRQLRRAVEQIKPRSVAEVQTMVEGMIQAREERLGLTPSAVDDVLRAAELAPGKHVMEAGNA